MKLSGWAKSAASSAIATDIVPLGYKVTLDEGVYAMNQESTTRARTLRREQTVTESKLWAYLRNRQLGAAKFSRQVSIGSFFADFCCREVKLITVQLNL